MWVWGVGGGPPVAFRLGEKILMIVVLAVLHTPQFSSVSVLVYLLSNDGSGYD